ncbi:MAG TPA: hypothetical protein VM451_10125 [Candidatus Limnocylindria bacterium]|nr:hypothetical protein [Candidatus Limnocylindria bacterium]
MSWLDDIRSALSEALSKADATARHDLEQAFDSGATSPAEAQSNLDRRVAEIADSRERADMVATVASIREGLEANLEGSGYTGNLSSLTLAQLAQLEGARQRWGLEGDFVLPTNSALTAAAEAQRVGGTFVLDSRSGSIEIYDPSGKLHEFIVAGQEGRPPEVVGGELLAGSDVGGRRVLPEDLGKYVAGTVEVTPEGDVIVTNPDGTTETHEHSDLAQWLADLKLAQGDIGALADVLGKGATAVGDAAIAGLRDTFGSFPSFGPSGGSPATQTGMGDRNATQPGSTSGTGSTSGGSGSGGSTRSGGNPLTPTSGRTTSDPMFDDDSSDTGSGSDDSSGSDDPDEPEEPASTGTGSSSGGIGGLDFSEVPDEVITGTADEDDDDEDGQREIIGAEEDDDEDDEEDDDEEESSTDAGYTPRPDDDQSWRNASPEEVEAALAAATARQAARNAGADRTDVKPAEFDPSVMVAAQARTEGLIGNPGPVIDGEGGFSGGFSGPAPIPDDDTPGMTPNGHDNGAEDPMQRTPTGPLVGGGGSDASSTATDPPDMPVQVLVTAEINVERPAGGFGLGQFGYVAGDPATSGGGFQGSGSNPGSGGPVIEGPPPQEMVQADISIDRGDAPPPDLTPEVGYLAGSPDAEPTFEPSDDDAATTASPVGRSLTPLTSRFAVPDSIDLDLASDDASDS